MPYYPAFLDMKNKRCVVIGGGHVALRKVNMLLDHEAKVTVISPDLCEELEQLGMHSVTLIQRVYQAGDINGSFVVVAATDNQVINEQVAEEAKEKGILINVVDVPALSSFIVPSYLKRGNLTIAVSTSGKSPAMARRIRIKLENEFGPEYAELISIVEAIRSELKKKQITISADRWQQALEIESFVNLIRSGKQEQVKQVLMQTLTEAEQ